VKVIFNWHIFIQSKYLHVVSGIILFLSVGLFIVQCSQPEKPLSFSGNEYIGDATCKTCHQKEHDEWLTSDHYKAMEVANDSTVLGDFNNQTYSADGVTSRFFKKDGKFFINTEGPDGKNEDYEIKYTFGYYPLQQYLVEFDRGRLQVTRQSWDSRKNNWFHQYSGEKIPHGDWLHWTGNAQNWNTSCGACHTTNYKKNYSFETDSYHTTYSQITVSCESCHGPAKNHVLYIESNEYKNGKRQPGSFLQLVKNSSQQTEMISCFPCHARRGEISANLLATTEILDNFIPEIPSNEFYYADGQANDEDYTYASFLQSQMYKHGVKCSNCHNPHSGKLIITGNGVCNQCHTKKNYDSPEHTFHPITTDGAQCKNCHMPSKYYMGNDLRHDHIFRAPRPDLSVKYGTPNACNNCHRDKSYTWANEAIIKWYGPERKYHFAEDLIPGSNMDADALDHLIKILKDTSAPPIIQATAVHYISGINSSQSLQNILQQLGHSDAQVRYRAVTGLIHFPAEQWLDKVTPLLRDNVRAVRIATANLLISLSNPELFVSLGKPYAKASSELNDYLMYQTDFAAGNVMAADYFYQLHDYNNAEKFYLRGLEKDNRMNYARLNLSTLYNVTNRNDKALKVLEDALKVDSKNDRIYFNLALLYNETNNLTKVEENLKKAIALHSLNPRVYYNYAILLQQKNQPGEAEHQYLNALKLAPNDFDINYAICVLYFQQKQFKKAIPYALTLKANFPGNPQVAALVQQLGI